MSKYLSQADFLTGILGTPEDLDVIGLGTVSIRALTMAEVTAIQRDHKDDTPGMMLAAVACGLVAPKLDAEAVDKMQSAAAGYVATIANRIMVLSGMIEADAKQGE